MFHVHGHILARIFGTFWRLNIKLKINSNCILTGAVVLLALLVLVLPLPLPLSLLLLLLLSFALVELLHALAYFPVCVSSFCGDMVGLGCSELVAMPVVSVVSVSITAATGAADDEDEDEDDDDGDDATANDGIADACDDVASNDVGIKSSLTSRLLTPRLLLVASNVDVAS